MNASLSLSRMGFVLAGTLALFQAAAQDVITPLAQTSSPDVSSTANSGAAPARTLVSPGVADVLKMLDSKVQPSVVEVYIKNSRVAYNLSADDIVALKERGVPDEIITTMMERGAELRGQPVTVPSSAAPSAPMAAYPASPYPDYMADYGYGAPYWDYGYPYLYGYPYSYSYWYGYPWTWFSPFYFSFFVGHNHHFHGHDFHHFGHFDHGPHVGHFGQFSHSGQFNHLAGSRGAFAPFQGSRSSVAGSRAPFAPFQGSVNRFNTAGMNSSALRATPGFSGRMAPGFAGRMGAPSFAGRMGGASFAGRSAVGFAGRAGGGGFHGGGGFGGHGGGGHR